MGIATNVESDGNDSTKRKKQVWRWVLAIILALIPIGIGASIYFPAVLVGGMLMDSCSANGIYYLWIVWLWVLWAVVMLVSALVPSILIIKNRRWRWVFVSMVVGAVVSVMWYILWYVIVLVAYNLLGDLVC
jgi:MFS family permease